MPILLVGGVHDPQIRRVAAELRSRGGGCSILDTLRFPADIRISFSAEGAFLGNDGIPVPRVVYLRGLACHPLMPGLEDGLASRPHGLIAQCEEKRAMLESILLEFQRQGAHLVNTLEANAQHGRKPYQLALLTAAGLPVPPWLCTNSPRSLRAFAKRRGPLVYKPLAGGATVRLLERRDFSARRLATLASAPVLFQTYAPGISVRAFVIGGRVAAAAEILSSEIDYRRQEDEVRPTRLSPLERKAVLLAARTCRMEFTGVDLIRRADGFSVLECNPSPMFAVFEKKTGLKVAGPLAERLLRLAHVLAP